MLSLCSSLHDEIGYAKMIQNAVLLFFQALNGLNNEDLKAKLGLEDLSEGWGFSTLGRIGGSFKFAGLQRVNGSSWLQLQIRRAISLVNLFFSSCPTDLRGDFQDLPTLLINFAHGKAKRLTLVNPFDVEKHACSWFMNVLDLF